MICNGTGRGTTTEQPSLAIWNSNLIYLHYNSGLHISDNGKLFSALLETIIKQSSQPTELFILAHSMGGLIARSACHYAKKSGQTWLSFLQKLIFLGTPHHGALLEKGGNWINSLLEISPYSAPFSRLGKVRSCGVTDLRYGNITEADWKDRDRFVSERQCPYQKRYSAIQ